MWESRKTQSLKRMGGKGMGCGSCSALRLSSMFSPQRRGRRDSNHHSRGAEAEAEAAGAARASPFTAVEKESAAPYVDFRASMLQMIVENQLYTKEDLRNLLTCFLQLNAPSLHGVIIAAFTDIWNSIVLSSSSSAAHPPSPPPPRRRRQRRNPSGRPPKPYVRPNSYQI